MLDMLYTLTFIMQETIINEHRENIKYNQSVEFSLQIRIQSL